MIPSAAFQQLLDEVVGSGALSSAVALAGTPEGIEWTGAAGLARRPDRPAEVESRFDLGSLTKPFAATLALVLDARGELPLGLPIGEVWPQADPRLARLPLSGLLSHRAGLAAWAPLYRRCRSRQEVLDLLLGGELLGADLPTYSDLDYLLWARAAEERLGRPLWDLLRERVLDPLGLSAVTLAPGDQPEAADVAESRMGTGKEVELAAEQGIAIEDLGPPAPGTVQDGNARFLAGLGIALPGHAGLFGRAEDLFALGVEWLRPGRLFSEEAGHRALSAGSGLYALGWVRRNVEGSAGPALGPDSFGHSGFAGGSLWIDPDREWILVLLGARTDPAIDINSWRRRFHALAYDAG
ncbi:MAG TPA: serine hydrolase [Thermoanaerobaculia bacterium]|nr:serine hydrolase [Thermoanaerobaculia bacterium]